jgi:hypothetical protein
MQEVWMNTIGVVLLAAATATSGIGKPHAYKNWLRPHAVSHAAPTGPPMTAQMAAGMGDAGAMGGNRRFPNVRSQVYFVDPPGMQIGWQAGGGAGSDRVYLPAQLTVPARYNFNQGYIYRLKVSNIPGRPGLNLYPTIEVAPSTPATDAFLTHNPIPAQFTEEDFDQVTAGNFVTKVIYLPDPKYQELAIAGVETLVSTRLEPGVDPILEADKRGTILMIVRLGAIDLEMPSTGASAPMVGSAPVMAPTTLAPVPFEPAPVTQPPDTTPAPAVAPADTELTPPAPAIPAPDAVPATPAAEVPMPPVTTPEVPMPSVNP